MSLRATFNLAILISQLANVDIDLTTVRSREPKPTDVVHGVSDTLDKIPSTLLHRHHYGTIGRDLGLLHAELDAAIETGRHSDEVVLQ